MPASGTDSDNDTQDPVTWHPSISPISTGCTSCADPVSQIMGLPGVVVITGLSSFAGCVDVIAIAVLQPVSCCSFESECVHSRSGL